MFTGRFFRHFIASPTQTGALLPSSTGLARLITDEANIESASAVVELGPGTGVFTRQIIERVAQNAVFFAMEINTDFVEMLKKTCPKATVFNDSATNTTKYLKQFGLEHCDTVISGLPWASFETQLQHEIMDAVIDALKPGGRFVTFTYIQSPFLPAGRRFRRLLSDRFSKVTTSRIVWRNLPPAFVYCAIK